MPELPDVTVYAEAIERSAGGTVLDAIRVLNPFVLRSVSPSPEHFAGRRLQAVRRLAKQLVLEFEGGCFALVHLMIAGRLRWRPRGGSARPKPLAAFDFESGTLLLTEAGTRRRAALHLLANEASLDAFDRGGLDPLEVGLDDFVQRLQAENHTLKRALTDQRLLAGIGNAYSDEILLAAQLSPFRQSRDLTRKQWQRLHRAMQTTLLRWTERLRSDCGEGFPEKVTAFREGMAVHGRFGQPCPVCGSPVQRIVYASKEANYCARCQTGGRILADRALSRLLKANWPRRLEDLE